jgi:hypothetical protein
MLPNPKFPNFKKGHAFFRRAILVLLGIAAISLLFNEEWFSRTFPVLAWRYGTPTMQAHAVPILIERIRPGMSFENVLQIIGRGSDDWPNIRKHKLLPDDIVEFNVRAEYNTGIDVRFVNGRVVSAGGYD